MSKKQNKTKTLFRLPTNCCFERDSLVYICENCNQVGTDEETFENHIKVKHMIYVCVRCTEKKQSGCTLLSKAESFLVIQNLSMFDKIPVIKMV